MNAPVHVSRVTIGSPRDCERCEREMPRGTPAIREVDETGYIYYRHVRCPREADESAEMERAS